MNDRPLVFSATGKIRTFIAPVTATYVIEASGAQGGAGGGKGARLKGSFKLCAGDFLQILVGRQGTAGDSPHQPAAGGGGGSFVWRGRVASPLPPKPMLAAGGGGGGNGGDGLTSLDAGDGGAPGGRNGFGGGADHEDHHYSGGGGAGWFGAGAQGSAPTQCGGGEQWNGGTGANYCCNVGGNGGFGGGGGGAFLGQGSGGGGGFSGGGGGTQAGPGGGGGGSFNAGTNQSNTPGAQTGDGCVSILAVPELATFDWPTTAPRSAASANALKTAGSFHRDGDSDGTFAGYF